MNTMGANIGDVEESFIYDLGRVHESANKGTRTIELKRKLIRYTRVYPQYKTHLQNLFKGFMHNQLETMPPGTERKAWDCKGCGGKREPNYGPCLQCDGTGLDPELADMVEQLKEEEEEQQWQ